MTKGKKLPPGAIGWTTDGRPIIPKKGESNEQARKRVEAHKHK
jgi:hypothetical protein